MMSPLVRLLFVLLMATLTLSEKLVATPIFSGSFVNLGVDSIEKNVSVNYPRAGKHGICGVEIKSDVIVLNRDVWRKLADMLEVQELHDDRPVSIVQPLIESGYSPTLRYLFTKFEFDYGTLVFRTKNHQTLRDVANIVLGGKLSDVSLVAVAYSCDSGTQRR
jgi:hypothetical protein